MNDHIAGEDLAAYVDGKLDGGKKMELESHFSHCHECLGALAEIVEIQSSRVMIPGGFLRQVLGEKQETQKLVFPLRQAFGIAAAFLVVVFIGYFFLSGGRFWQAGSSAKEKAAGIADREVLRPAAEVEKAGRSLSAQAGPGAAAKEKKKLVANEGMTLPAPAKPLEKQAEQILALKSRTPVPTDEHEVREQGQKLAEPAAQSFQAEMDKLGDGQLARSRSAETTAAAGAVQPALAAQARSAPPAGKGMASPAPQLRFRIEGQALWADLRDPGLLDDWSWFKKGMILELELDSAGAVTAVIPVGTWERSLLEKAEKAARQLTFSVSDKKSRRARMSVYGSQPN